MKMSFEYSREKRRKNEHLRLRKSYFKKCEKST